MDINNFKYTNSTFDVIKSLMITKNLLSDQDFTLIMDNVTCTDLEFSNKGYIFDFNHQLPGNLVVKNSDFSNLDATLIKIESGNQQNKSLSTRVLFQNTPFININSKFNSFININEGGVLRVEHSNFTHLMTYGGRSYTFLLGHKNQQPLLLIVHLLIIMRKQELFFMWSLKV